MQLAPQIKAAYDWMIAAYQADVSAALAAGDAIAVDRLEEKRDALERGVFVMLFAQFEKEVTDCFERARDARSAESNWANRRGWDVPILQGRRVPFETRLALVLDKNGPFHAKAWNAYGLRNRCAHGEGAPAVGSIDQFVQDLYTWQAALKP